MIILRYHFAALIFGVIMDLIIGDPHSLPHPIRLIGRFVSFLENRFLTEGLRAEEKRERGMILVIMTAGIVFISMICLVASAYYLSPLCGMIFEAVMSFYALAARSLYDESRAVVKALDKSLDEGRRSLSMIVSRDTEKLDENGVIRAVVETISENCSDGVIAPFLYLFFGGPSLGFFYKAVNTMDSMLGYHNDRYEDFGKCAARLDDALNFIPSRFTAFCCIAAAYIFNKDFDGENALRIFKRDRSCHKSPNSGQPEAAFAGALDIRLGGAAPYFGEWVDKPFIGDNIKEIDRNDIKRAHKLMFAAYSICIIPAVVVFMLLK